MNCAYVEYVLELWLMVLSVVDFSVEGLSVLINLKELEMRNSLSRLFLHSEP